VAVVCPECGGLNADAHVRCTVCGATLDDEPVALVADGAAARERPSARRRISRRAVAVVAVLVLGAWAILAWRLSRRSERAVVPTASWTTSRERITRLPNARGITLIAAYGMGLRFADLGTGQIRELDFSTVWPSVSPIITMDDAVVVGTADSVLSVRHLKKLHPDVVVIAHERAGRRPYAYSSFPSTRSDRFWLTEDRVKLKEIRADGRVLAQYVLPSGWLAAIAATGDDRLLIESGGRSGWSIWDPRSGRFGPGLRTTRTVQLMAVGRRYALWRDENCTSDCRAVLTDLRTGGTRELTLPNATFGETSRFSPKEDRIAISSFRTGAQGPIVQVTVLDVPSFRVTWFYEEPSGTGLVNMTWTPSEDWLFLQVSSGQLAHRLGTSGVIPIRWPDVTYVGEQAILTTR